MLEGLDPRCCVACQNSFRDCTSQLTDDVARLHTAGVLVIRLNTQTNRLLAASKAYTKYVNNEDEIDT